MSTGHQFSSPPAIKAVEPAEVSNDFLQRLIRFYREQPVLSELGEIWDGIHKAYYEPLDAALRQGRLDDLRELLRNLYQGATLFGMYYDNLESMAQHWDGIAIGAGISVGTVPEINPDQSAPQTLDRDRLVLDLGVAGGNPLGWRKGPPGLYGVSVEDRVIPSKSLEAAANYIMLQRLWSAEPYHVLELGGGLGSMALAFHDCLQSEFIYSIVDLPLVAVIQGYHIASLAGEAWVSFWGEERSEIHVCGPNWPEQNADLYFNQDSLPEIPHRYAVNYLSRITIGISQGHKAMFVSINHESPLANQRRVFEQTLPFCMKLCARFPYVMRPGYMVEVFRGFEF